MRPSSLACLLVASGCAASPAPPAVGDLFPGGVPPSAFSEREPGGPWRLGDTAVLHVVARNGKRTTERYVHLVLSDPGTVGTLHLNGFLDPNDASVQARSFDETLSTYVRRFDVVVFDGEGRPVAASQAELPAILLQRGLYHGAEAFGRWVEEGSQAMPTDSGELRDLLLSFMAPAGLLGVMANNDALRPILWAVVERPSFWSLLTGFGQIELSFQIEDDVVPERKACTLPAFSEPVQAYRVPFVLFVNDELALRLALTVCPPDPPFLITGGVLLGEGEHPRDPERTVRIELVSSTRGEGDALPTEPPLTIFFGPGEGE